MATFRGSYYRLNAYQEPAIPKGLTELRTHGVNGAPPEQLLNDPHPVLVSGDDTAAFYRSRERPSGYAQTLEDRQERLAQGPCAVAFSQRLPAAIRNIHTEPDWEDFAQVLVNESVFAALSVPVELDGGVIGTLDVYVGQPRDWDPSEVAALQAYAGLVASLLSAAVTAQVKGRLADQL
jgi:GAF domain-containing protein